MKKANRYAAGADSYPEGIKWTKQRKDVYHVLNNADSPLSALQIYNHTIQEEEDSSYAISTIYRILAAFEEKGFVIKSTWMNDGTTVYEWNHGGHTHYAVCMSCHKRVPLQKCPFEHLYLTEETEDFKITGHKLELYGYCRNCEEAGKI